MAEHDPQTVKVVVVGHAQHGKSTLIGRMLAETGGLAEGRIEAVRAMCGRRGMPFEWAFLLDALQAEREQGLSIDTTQTRLCTERRALVIIDTPGHREFVRNMITGAAPADAALLVVDVTEGMQEQTRRHAYLVHLLGIRQVAVAVNKMDLADFSFTAFADVAADARACLAELGILPTHIVPLSAQTGDNVARRGAAGGAMDWYEGMTLVQALDQLAPAPRPTDLPLRLPIQDIYKFDQRRIIAGRIESGRLRVGDTVLLSPSNKTARVSSIEAWGAAQPVLAAATGQSIGITLDEQIFVERGEVISHLEAAPVLSTVFRARLFWLGRRPLAAGDRYKARLNTAELQLQVQEVETVIDVADLSARSDGVVERNGVAEVVLRARSTVVLDPFTANPATGRVVLLDDDDIVGGGIINMRGYPDQRHALTVKSTNITSVDHRVGQESRSLVNGHKSGILWLTGLSGAGKTTLALELEQRLFRKGYQVFVLDGDNIRHGLSADLGFSPDDRAENIRRVGEVAALFARAGMLVITAFISPYRSDRDRVRAIAPDLFHEIYVRADLATCEARDPKGLYKKARRGEIPDFTGISAPYEPPGSPELVVDTGSQDVAQSLAVLLDYVETNLAIKAKAPRAGRERR
ncbi:MAG: adenylyl-sulfate kinase [Proteobacteria bacterium]|nr:adenylyl-sulfate kinase [Pseudomonadota bacterium]